MPNPPAPYPGGKRLAAALIWSALGPVTTYIDPFCGMCADAWHVVLDASGGEHVEAPAAVEAAITDEEPVDKARDRNPLEPQENTMPVPIIAARDSLATALRECGLMVAAAALDTPHPIRGQPPPA